MDALERRFMEKADKLDPNATFEAYLRVVPVLTANILTSTDEDSGKFLTTLIFKQVVLVEKTLKVPGLLDYVADTTRTLVYKIHGVNRGETLTLTGGVNGNELALVPPNGAVVETIQERLRRRRAEVELAQLDAAEEAAKAKTEAVKAMTSVVVARAKKEERESTLVGQVFTPENAADVGISSLFAGAVSVAAWTAVRMAGKVAVGTVAAAGGLAQAGAREAVTAAAGLATQAKDAAASVVADTATKFNPIRWFSAAPSPTPSPTPMPTLAPMSEPADQLSFLDKAGQDADGISGGLFHLLQLPFRQISTGDQILLATSMFLIIDIITLLVIKVGRKATAKETSLAEVFAALKENPKTEKDQQQFLESATGQEGVYRPALADAPAAAPAFRLLTNPEPVEELMGSGMRTRTGGKKRRTFRNRKGKKPKTSRSPTFVY